MTESENDWTHMYMEKSHTWVSTNANARPMLPPVTAHTGTYQVGGDMIW